jgi:hypothetical protein
MKKKLIDSIEHFDRFDTDKYVEVVNAKNGIYDEEEHINKQFNQGCMEFFKAIIFLTILTFTIYALCFIRG